MHTIADNTKTRCLLSPIDCFMWQQKETCNSCGKEKIIIWIYFEHFHHFLFNFLGSIFILRQIIHVAEETKKLGLFNSLFYMFYSSTSLCSLFFLHVKFHRPSHGAASAGGCCRHWTTIQSPQPQKIKGHIIWQITTITSHGTFSPRKIDKSHERVSTAMLSNNDNKS